MDKVVVFYKDRLLRFGFEFKRANKARKLVKELIDDGGEEDDKNNSSHADPDRKSTRLNSSHITPSRMPSSA